MDVLMPQLGETVAEGKITTWFKKVGDAVKPGDNLFEIETDKVSMEVPAIAPGTITEIRVSVGETALVGAIVAIIGGDGAAAAPQAMPVSSTTGAPPKTPAAPKQAPIAASSAPATQTYAPRPSNAGMDPFREVNTPTRNFGPARLAGGTVVTPLARRLAGEAGIDLTRIKGSGPHGRVVARDIESAKASQPVAGRASAGPTADQVKALFPDGGYEEVPLDTMRRTIARRLIEAKQTIPHFYLTADVEVARLAKLREEANASATKGKDGEVAFKLSLNDLVIKAWAAALQRVPEANAVWAEDRILRFRHSDIGIAVALDGGLITPVIRRAETKTLTAISAEMKDLGERARTKKLKADEIQGGASAISNLGMYGVREFSAIINPPHATILAVGASRRAPVETTDGGVRFVSQMSVTLSCDHRVVDGALGAQLLAAFKGFIEAPVTMMV